ncbi:MAG: polysaccharide biosynthesis protein [Oscillospiraceae bacterium]
MMPVAFIDDDERLWGKRINGIKVFGGREVLKKTVLEQQVDMIVLSVGTAKQSRIRELADLCMACGTPVKIIPTIIDMHRYLRLSVKDVKSLSAEYEVLQHHETETRQDWLDEFIRDKVVLVTGGSGSIGSEICRQALALGCRTLIAFDINENGLFYLNRELSPKYGPKFCYELGTIRDTNRVDSVLKSYRPDIVFHAAAHKHVAISEKNPFEAVKNNALGSYNVFRQCVANNVGKVILISSDKAVKSSNIMGATKRVAELALLSFHRKSETVMAAVRFGNVFGSTGSVVPIFLEQIAAGGPVTVTHRDMTRYFMTISDAVKLVLHAGALAKGGEIFFLDMGDPIRIYDLACDLIRFSGYEPGEDIEIKEIGIIPGEKLHEELSYESDNVELTEHKGIYVCTPPEIDNYEIERLLEKLNKACRNKDRRALAETLFSVTTDVYQQNLVSTEVII